MKVATFNVRHGESTAGHVEVGRLARTCAGFEVDVLALQEVDKWMRRSRWADLAKRVGRQAGMAHAFGPALRRGWFGRYGNALLVRGRIADVEVLALPVMSAEPRAALLATAETRGASVSVAVTHLSVRPEERDAQLAEVLGALSARPSPRLLFGDLNARDVDVARLTDPAGLQLVTAGPTFPALNPRSQIDHVGVEGLVLVRSWVPETPMSDHRPLVVELAPPA